MLPLVGNVAATAQPAPRRAGYSRRRTYVLFLLPALVVIFAVIIFPWLFTIWMSLNDWQVGLRQSFVGLANFQTLATNTRFLETIPRTLYFTVLSVIFPLVLGVFAAEVLPDQVAKRMAHLPFSPCQCLDKIQA